MSKLEISNVISFEQSLNVLTNFVTLSVLKLERFIEVNFEHPENISCIEVKDEVSKLERSNLIREEQSLNITENVQSMANMFYNCYSLNKINISNFDTRKVKNMFRMFFGCTSLESIDLSSFETRKLIEMSKMFYGSGITNIDISNFDTENVRSFLDLFNGCRNLTTIKISKIRIKISEIY